MNKKLLSKSDICAKFITPHLVSAGRDEIAQIRCEVSFTKKRIIVRGKLVACGQAKYADYIKNAPFDRMGTVVELLKPFGNHQGFEQAVHQLQAVLYQDTA